MELERDEIQRQEDEFRKKERELEEKERLQPWNVDTIGKESWSKTIINKPKDTNKTAPVANSAKNNEEEEHSRTLKYFEENEQLLKKFSMLQGFDRMEEFILENPHLASEYATNWMTIEALNFAIEEDVRFLEMKT